jgi:hypothetical protein
MYGTTYFIFRASWLPRGRHQPNLAAGFKVITERDEQVFECYLMIGTSTPRRIQWAQTRS